MMMEMNSHAEKWGKCLGLSRPRRPFMRGCLVVLMQMVAFNGAIGNAGEPPTKALQVLNLSREQAANRHPVLLSGVVTFSDSELPMRSPEDVTPVQAAPWWTGQRVLWVVLAALVAGMVSVASAGVLMRANRRLRIEVADRESAEAALIREQHLMRTLMDHVPDHIWFKDAGGVVLRVNRALALHLGLNDPAEAEGRPAAELLQREEPRMVAEDEAQVMTSRQAMTKEEMIARPDGSLSWRLTT
jgi:PAS domain S-box-containing protein